MHAPSLKSPSFAVRYRGAWMQKHPSPSHRRSDFHWHPSDLPARIRAELADNLARYGSERASVWLIGDDYLAWARSFSATAPGDQRRYTGLAATVATTDEGPWQDALLDILAHMPLPPAGPYSTSITHGYVDRETHLPVADEHLPLPPAAVDPERLRALFTPAELARGLYLGGAMSCRDPHDEHLPLVFGHLLTWMPRAERAHPRQLVLVDRPLASGTSAPNNRGMINLLHYLTLAWFCPPAIRERDPQFTVRAWQLVLELAFHLERPLPDLLGDLGAVAAAWDTTEDLRSYLLSHRILRHEQIAACDRRAPKPLFASSVPDAGWLWNRITHYWGRQLLPASDAELARMAALLAQRIAVDHLFHLDAPERHTLPMRYLHRLLYESVLPAERRELLLRALAQYVPSLLTHPEVPLD
ncbi:hypothetical protein [Haliangium ochraceum]|uniref:Uncharacterized protein n=1 Tax=Haliangium ochraceum (strain DSM 14365 / JCM 11303 / SMP-2) TaxID=502025 RepID=D0LKE6_HALO1|nr:hypothetical protein [Haliangium ochraceum]ACY14994.1 hypothetical protein Hoch_2458 [Haliangium ochraceum DSM 14365]